MPTTIYTNYLITNIINNDQYIGQSGKSLRQRWKQHCASAMRGSPSYLHRAIRKYGKESFTIKPILQTKQHLYVILMEIEFIEEYDTYNNGYNMTLGGEGCRGLAKTEEHKRKIGDANRGNILPPVTNETKRKISDATRGIKKHLFQIFIVKICPNQELGKSILKKQN